MHARPRANARRRRRNGHQQLQIPLQQQIGDEREHQLDEDTDIIPQIEDDLHQRSTTQVFQHHHTQGPLVSVPPPPPLPPPAISNRTMQFMHPVDNQIAALEHYVLQQQTTQSPTEPALVDLTSRYNASMLLEHSQTQSSLSQPHVSVPSHFSVNFAGQQQQPQQAPQQLPPQQLPPQRHHQNPQQEPRHQLSTDIGQSAFTTPHNSKALQQMMLDHERLQQALRQNSGRNLDIEEYQTDKLELQFGHVGDIRRFPGLHRFVCMPQALASGDAIGASYLGSTSQGGTSASNPVSAATSCLAAGEVGAVSAPVIGVTDTPVPLPSPGANQSCSSFPPSGACVLIGAGHSGDQTQCETVHTAREGNTLERSPSDSPGEREGRRRTRSSSSNPSRRKTVRWDKDEVQALLDGVTREGIGKWAAILKGSTIFNSVRTSVDLKDKWRNLSSTTRAQALAARAQSGAISDSENAGESSSLRDHGAYDNEGIPEDEMEGYSDDIGASDNDQGNDCTEEFNIDSEDARQSAAPGFAVDGNEYSAEQNVYSYVDHVSASPTKRRRKQQGVIPRASLEDEKMEPTEFDLNMNLQHGMENDQLGQPITRSMEAPSSSPTQSMSRSDVHDSIAQITVGSNDKNQGKREDSYHFDEHVNNPRDWRHHSSSHVRPCTPPPALLGDSSSVTPPFGDTGMFIRQDRNLGESDHVSAGFMGRVDAHTVHAESEALIDIQEDSVNAHYIEEACYPPKAELRESSDDMGINDAPMSEFA